MLAYDYKAGSARLDDLPEIPISPHLYVLCDRCATSLRAPRGWILDDRRGPAPMASAPAPVIDAAAPVIDAAAPADEDFVLEPEPRRDDLVPEPEREREDAQRQLAFGYSS